MKQLLVLIAITFISILVIGQPPNVSAGKGVFFGEKTSAEQAMSVEKMMSLINSKSEVNKTLRVKIKGVVTDVCTMEGCWIKIQSPDGKMMVKMKDHQFTVPVALNGKTVIIDGIAEEEITSIEELKHYAQDAGKSKAEIEAIKIPKKEIVVTAKGLLVI